MSDGEARSRVRQLLLHSRTQTAVKAAVAAGLSWVLAEGVAGAVPGFDVTSYVYYAPLGAIVATHPTVAESVRTARSAIVALALGATVGLLVQLSLEPGVLSLAVAVGAGVAVGTLPWVGSQRSWVPIVALFVLVVGGDHPLDYAVAYVGLTALGTLCGVAVNVAVPALRLTAAQEAIDALSSTLAAQLCDSAVALRQVPAPSAAEWQQRTHDPIGESARTRAAVQHVVDATRGNVRARLHSRQIQRQQDLAQALQRVAVLVEDLPEMLMDTYVDGTGTAPLDADLAGMTAESLERLADLVRACTDDLDVSDARVEHAEEAVQRLTAAFGTRRDLDATDVALLGSVVGTLRRALAVFAPSWQTSR